LRKRLAGAASAAAILIVMAAPAHAHVEVSTEEAPAGGEVAFDFLVGHGCDESGTTSLSVQMPDGVAEVAPEDEPGWSLTTKESGENVTEVTWTARGKPLDPHHLGRFGISLALPDGQPGDAVYFPTIQRCEQGVTRWIQIPSTGQTEDDLQNPAPAITLTAGDEGGHAASDDESATAENLDAQPAAAAEEDGSDAIAWVALAVGAAGLIVGGAAFARSRG
jgi:periplasmic copper chaperone A